jgi:hypothetical protein
MGRILYIDADTILYSSAAKEEINKCLATNTINNKSKLFESKTAFNEWHKEHSTHPKEVYTFKQEKELVGEISYACKSVRSKIEGIVEKAGCDDFRVCIQGVGNYRNEYISKYVDYKGQRAGKPLLYSDVFNYAVKKYKDKVIVTSGEETDDYLCKLAWKYWDSKHTIEDSPIVIGYCDKDIQQNCPSVLINYKKLEEGLFLNTHELQYKGFWKSVLIGDAADNIFGIVKLSDSTLKRYGIKKAKDNACGPVAAARIICAAESEKECAERVLEAYKLSWPDDYMERLQDMCFFLWLRREEDEMFDLKKYFDKLGVQYD